MFGLVALADVVALDVVTDEAARVRVVEGGAESMERLLGDLMAHAVHCGEQLWPQRRRRGDKDAAAMHDEAVHHGPSGAGRAVCDLAPLVDDVLERVRLLAEVIEDGELRGGQC